VDFVEICKVYVGKMVLKPANRIFNSDKIHRSYSDLNFGVTFLNTVYFTAKMHQIRFRLLEHSVWHLVAAILIPFLRINLPHFVQFKQYY